MNYILGIFGYIKNQYSSPPDPLIRISRMGSEESTPVQRVATWSNVFISGPRVHWLGRGPTENHREGKSQDEELLRF